MRNIIIAPFPPPLGGVGAAASNLLDVFSLADCDVEIFDTSSRTVRENVNAVKGPRSYWRNLKLFFKLLGQTLGKPNGDRAYHVFVTSDTAFFRDTLIILALRLQRKQVVVHLHSKTQGEFFLAPSRLPFFGRILSLAQRVFVLSPLHFEFFSAYIPPGNLTILENFVQSGDFVAGTDTSASNMLYLSRLSEMKGTWELLKAVDIILNHHQRTDFNVTVAGAADTEDNEVRFRSYVDEQDLSSVVTFVGLVSGRKKTALFRENGVFLFPSRFENSPVTLKEATQAEMAIVASDIPSNLNILERNGNHLTFPVKDHEALAEAMIKIMDDKELFGKLRSNARTCPKFDEIYAREVLAPYLA